MAAKHVLLRNPRLRGWEYGMLRAFEDQITKQTGAEEIEVPDYGLHPLTKRMGHTMRLDGLRTLLPKKKLAIEADVIWYILMGPENYELDLFQQWNIQAKKRVVYMYDTLEPQFPLIKKLFSDDQFNVCITSFNDAVPHLESLTGKKWWCIEQAVPAAVFKPVAPEKKRIHSSSYGRRLPSFHAILKEFCEVNQLYYDYTTHNGRGPTAPENELYQQYAWHIAHSMFTVSWPVEITNPQRAGKLSPITCRWFEAGAAGTVILGQQPSNTGFESQLAPGMVVNLNPKATPAETFKSLESISENRQQLLLHAARLSEQNFQRWTWENRVKRILNIIDES